MMHDITKKRTRKDVELFREDTGITTSALSAPKLTLVMGYPGAGKTTLVREFIKNSGLSFHHFCDKQAAWLMSDDGSTAIFGRWQGYHPDGKSALAGRLDGTDRIHGSGFTKCVNLLDVFVKQRVTHVIAEGFLLLKPTFVHEAERLGFDVRLYEIDVVDSTALDRFKARDGENAKLHRNHKRWARDRLRWKKYSTWKLATSAEIVGEMMGGSKKAVPVAAS